MAEIDTTVNDRRRPGVQRTKRSSLRIDMTPMVDLGFLLVAFFVFTAELSKPVVTNLNMPTDGPPTELGKSNALTVIAGKNNTLYYYHGDWKEASAQQAILETNYSFNNGLGNIIRAKQDQLDKQPVNGEGRTGLMLLIKPGPDASYSNIVNLLDEALINDIKRYAIVKLDTDEAAWLHKHQ